MDHTKTALILYPNQLFAPELLPKADVIILVEEPLFFGADEQQPANLHKQKLVLHRASMRRYVEEVLWQKEFNVEYVELEDIGTTADILVKAQKTGAEQVMILDPTDHLIESRLKKALDETVETPFELKVLPSPGFLLKRSEVREFFSSKTKHRFSDFYQWQRERFNVLIDKNYKPAGGQWMYDAPKQVALAEGETAPGFDAFGDNGCVHDAKKWVDKNFTGNPGDFGSFFWPTSHDEAAKWLKDFIDNRLGYFSVHQQALDDQAVLLYHSGISAALNIGLLTPRQVVNTVIAAQAKAPVALIDLEGFIRQVLGWREYVRGIYVTQNINTKGVGSSAVRSLHPKWWDGDTGLPPVDDVIKKVKLHAYASNAERLNVIANIMLLCDIHPQEVHKWFCSLFIDAYDWVTTPNVYAAMQLSDLGGIWPNVYISGSEDVVEMGNYQKDVWCDAWDGLYWSFLERHKTILAAGSRTKHLLHELDSISPEHRRISGYRAQDFIATLS